MINKILNKIFKFDMSGGYTRFEMYEIYIANYKFWNIWRDAAYNHRLAIADLKKKFEECK